jgi:hypothetical protein
MLLFCLQKWYTTFGNHDMVINGEGSCHFLLPASRLPKT